MAFGFTTTPTPPVSQGTSAPLYKSYQELKAGLHRDLLNKIDLERLTTLQDVRARTQVQAVIYDLIGASNVPLSSAERERICREVLHEVFGLGPSSRSCRMHRSPIFWSTLTGRFTSNGPASSNLPTSFLRMRHTCAISLTR